MPPRSELNATGALYEELMIQAWAFFRNGAIEQAEALCRDLILEPRIGDLHKAGCHTILACGNDNYVYHAEQALELYTHMYDLEKESPGEFGENAPGDEAFKSQQDLIKSAQKLLERANADFQLIEDDYRKQIERLGEPTAEETINADMEEVADELDADDAKYAAAMAKIQAESEAMHAEALASFNQPTAPASPVLTVANLPGLLSPEAGQRSDFAEALMKEMEEMRQANAVHQPPSAGQLEVEDEEDPDAQAFLSTPLPSRHQR